MTIDEQIEILRAVKEGKKIEAQLIERPDSGWHEWFGTVDFCNYAYHIVPEPRRFIIAREPGMKQLIALPYGNFVPEIYTIVCIAVEEPNIGTRAAKELGMAVAK